MQVELSYPHFFDAKQNSPDVDRVLYDCIAHELPLRLNLGPAGVSLSASRAEHELGALTLTGRWRSPALEAAYHSAGALLLVPFILLIENLCFPPRSLYTLGRGDRSVADLFMRNLFFAACRRDRMDLQTAANGSNAAVTQGSRDLARRYLWIAKSYIKDDVLAHSHAAELIVASAHLPSFKLSDPLMETGAADLRRAFAQASHSDGTAEQKHAFLQARKRMLATILQDETYQRVASQKRKHTRPQVNLLHRDGLIAFPFHWQVPAATEKTAYEAIAAAPDPLPFEYIGLPWATIIDGLCRDAGITTELLTALKLAGELPSKSGKRVTVTQHIHAMKFVELFKACGITDVFWPHATQQQREIEGIRVHPFPLFPAQAPETIAVDLERPRRYLANFIGAYNPKVYLTNVREVIFNDANEAGDLLIIKREAWHFDRAVYKEQIEGLPADEQRLLLEKQQTEEYLNAIRDSWFTLCPSGSGPNTIRIFESLCLGSIPIILTRDLRLPGPKELWAKAALIEDDSEAGYRRAIAKARGMNAQDRIEMLQSGAQLSIFVGPGNFANLIVDGVS